METARKLSKTLKFDLSRGHSALRSRSIDLRSEKFFQILTLGPPVTAPVIYSLKVMLCKSPDYLKLLLFIQNFYIEENLESHRLCDNELGWFKKKTGFLPSLVQEDYKGGGGHFAGSEKAERGSLQCIVIFKIGK